MNSLYPSAECSPAPSAVPSPVTTLDALARWAVMADGAYSPNTCRAMKADGALFQAFCEARGVAFFPAIPDTIRQFIQNCELKEKKQATIRRYVATVARAHMGAGLPNPCSSEEVRLALKQMGRTTSARQRQALALGWTNIKEFVESAGKGLRADRERALLCTAYDTMARRSELVALNVEDLSILPNGSATILIRRSKTDRSGDGAAAYLSRNTVHWLQLWMERSKIKNGAIFRRLIGRHRIGNRLHADIISDIYKRVAAYLQMPAKQVARVSGHSIRIGATQDLLALNIDLASVMQAGRWKSTAMPMRYGEDIFAARGGMARAAQLQHRESAEEMHA